MGTKMVTGFVKSPPQAGLSSYVRSGFQYDPGQGGYWLTGSASDVARDAKLIRREAAFPERRRIARGGAREPAPGTHARASQGKERLSPGLAYALTGLGTWTEAPKGDWTLQKVIPNGRERAIGRRQLGRDWYVVFACSDGVYRAQKAGVGGGVGASVVSEPRPPHEKPLAVKGLTSYRLKGRYGWIMIGAKNHEDAMNEAARSTDHPLRKNLEVWNGSRYVSAYKSR